MKHGKITSQNIYQHVVSNGPRTVAQIAKSFVCRQSHVYWTALTDSRLALDTFVIIDGVKIPVTHMKQIIIRDAETFVT